MTAAQVKTAARLLGDVPADEIVTLSEIGSEGAVLRIGARRPGSSIRDDTWLIARNGDACHSDGRRVRS